MDTLNILLDAGMIDENILEKSIKLRKEYMDLEQNTSELFNADSVKTSESWKTILELSDEIRELLYW